MFCNVKRWRVLAMSQAGQMDGSVMPANFGTRRSGPSPITVIAEKHLRQTYSLFVRANHGHQEAASRVKPKATKNDVSESKLRFFRRLQRRRHRRLGRLHNLRHPRAIGMDMVVQQQGGLAEHR